MSDCINPICAEKGRDHCMNDMPGATCYGYEPTHKTNADQIRAMTDEELAVLFGRIQRDAVYYCNGGDQKYPYPDGWLEWLKQEAKE